METICPHCFSPIKKGEQTCPKCTRQFNPGDWGQDILSLIAENVNFKGEREKTNVGNYTGKPVIFLNNPAQRYYIGDNADGCFNDIVIAGAAARNAILYKNKATNEWWIVNAALKTPVLLNGEFCINQKLTAGDCISVAGVSLTFQGNSLQIAKEHAEGLSVEIRNLSAKKKNKDYILRDISFKVNAGEFVGILGPSGCGKSSVLERLVGLADYSEGEILINQKPYKEHKKDIQAQTAFVPQDIALHNDFSVDDEISCFCKIRGIVKKEEEIAAVLGLLGLADKRKERIGNLSGGQKRRIGIALELLRDPQLLVLDEPTAGLDPATETEIMEHLRRISRRKQTVLCSTHIMGNLDKFDLILVLAKGRVVFFGSPDELKAHFHIVNPISLYRELGQGSNEKQKQIAIAKEQEYRQSSYFPRYQNRSIESGEIPHSKAISLLDSLRGYWGRYFKDFMSFRTKGTKKAFWGSAAFIQLLLQPVLTALVLKSACAYHLCSGGYFMDLFFFCSIAVFWLGLNNAIREFVKERVPWRCLERLERIQMSCYIISKIFWCTLQCFVQVAVFCIVLFVIPAKILGLVIFAPPEGDIRFSFSFTGYLILCVCCFSGTLLALAVSAACKKENAAVALLPIILIPILFFSMSIMRYEDYIAPFEHHSANNTGKYLRWACTLSAYFPCHQPAHLLELQSTNRTDNNAGLKYTGYCVIYSLIMFSAIFGFQWISEKKWKGR